MSSNATVAEDRERDLPLWSHPEWRERFPWLVQGTTGRGENGSFDLGLSGVQPAGEVLERWRGLMERLEIPCAVHSRQVHGVELTIHEGAGAPGLLVMQGTDGHLTRERGLLLTVSVADCVPVFLVDPRNRAVGAVHAGWRGVAGGIVERAIHRLRDRFDSSVEDLWLHCGPAICGECYEVGGEVHRAVRPQAAPPPDGTPIDLRAAVVEQARALGLGAARLSTSAHCTRCGPGPFFSHRGGFAQRQMGVIGIRAGGA